MGYTIEYSGEIIRKTRKSASHFRLRTMTLGFFILFLFTAKYFLQDKLRDLQNWLVPGFQAIEAFCQELIQHGG